MADEVVAAALAEVLVAGLAVVAVSGEDAALVDSGGVSRIIPMTIAGIVAAITVGSAPTTDNGGRVGFCRRWNSAEAARASWK